MIQNLFPGLYLAKFLKLPSKTVFSVQPFFLCWSRIDPTTNKPFTRRINPRKLMTLVWELGDNNNTRWNVTRKRAAASVSIMHIQEACIIRSVCSRGERHVHDDLKSLSTLHYREAYSSTHFPYEHGKLRQLRQLLSQLASPLPGRFLLRM